MGKNKSRSKREVYSDTWLLPETRKISNILSLYLKELEKKRTKLQVSGKKEHYNQSGNKQNRNLKNRKDQWN